MSVLSLKQTYVSFFLLRLHFWLSYLINKTVSVFGCKPKLCLTFWLTCRRNKAYIWAFSSYVYIFTLLSPEQNLYVPFFLPSGGNPAYIYILDWLIACHIAPVIQNLLCFTVPKKNYTFLFVLGCKPNLYLPFWLTIFFLRVKNNPRSAFLTALSPKQNLYIPLCNRVQSKHLPFSLFYRTHKFYVYRFVLGTN